MKSLQLVLALTLVMPATSAIAGELDGSRESVAKAHRIARRNDFTFLRTAAQVREFVREERLERVRSSSHVLVSNVSFPVARPAVKVQARKGYYTES